MTGRFQGLFGMLRGGHLALSLRRLFAAGLVGLAMAVAFTGPAPAQTATDRGRELPIGGLLDTVAVTLRDMTATEEDLARLNSADTLAEKRAAQPPAEKVFRDLAVWTPGLFEGFQMNMLISVFAMAIGTFIGVLVGMGRMSGASILKGSCWGLTQVMRNTPSIVFLFYLSAMIPFEIVVQGGSYLFGLLVLEQDRVFNIPGEIKATLGLAMPVIGFMSDNTVGAIRAIDQGQWDAGDALGMTRGETMRRIVLPQTMGMLVPPWMNYFAIIIMASSTASLVGVGEIVSATGKILDTAGPDNPYLNVPLYLYVMLWFFLFCYPITVITEYLTNRRKRA